MANHTFQVTFQGTADEIVAKAKSGIQSQGGTFTGDTATGNLIANTPAGKVKGNYRVSGQVISFEITDKPFVVPASVIEAQVRKFILS
ncbi:MAG: hypothetical protein U0441_34485 [Polyangiaceae bacterium]